MQKVPCCQGWALMSAAVLSPEVGGAGGSIGPENDNEMSTCNKWTHKENKIYSKFYWAGPLYAKFMLMSPKHKWPSVKCYKSKLTRWDWQQWTSPRHCTKHWH